MKRYLIALSLALLLLVTTRMSAQIFCDNFGEGGLAYSPQSNPNRLNVVKQLSNGRILAAGYYQPFGGKDGLLVKLLADGRVDNAFGEDRGIAIPDLYSGSEEIFDFESISSGRILVGGQTGNNGFVAMLNSTGSINPTFATNGRLELTSETFKDLQVFGSGVYVLRVSFLGVLTLTAHLTTNGNLIPSFGNGGTAVIPEADAFPTRPARLLRQPDGKWVVVMTSASNATNLDIIRVIRLQSNGRPDSTFGINGVVNEPELAPAVASALAVDTDGNLYLGGTVTSPGILFCKKWQPDGSAFNGFGVNSSPFHVPAGNGAQISDIQVDADKNVYFSGSRPDINGIITLMIGRWDADGEDFNDFGIKSWVYPGAASTAGRSMIRLANGKFLIAGEMTLPGEGRRGFVATFNSDGTIDPAFATQGAFVPKVMRSSEAKDVLVQQDGKIVVAGSHSTESTTVYGVARYLPDGTPDLTFGTGGYVAGPIEARIQSIYRLPDGKYLAGAGNYSPDAGEIPGVTGQSQVVFRLHADGRLDSTFGTNGKVARHWGNANHNNAFSTMTLDPDGKILIGGNARYTQSSYTDQGIIRMLPDGSLDPDFGNNGRVQLSTSSLNDSNSDLEIDSEGGILVSGSGYGTNGTLAVMFRLFPSGAIDSTFGTGGFASYSRPDGRTRFDEMVILDDGKILVHLYYEPTGTSFEDEAYACRLLANGRIDSTFGINGVAKVEIPGAYNYRNAGFGVDSAGNIFFSGVITLTVNRLYVACLRPDGSMNTDYGNNGYVLQADMSPSGDLAVGPTGNVYVSFSNYFLEGLNLACVGEAAATAIDPDFAGKNPASVVLFPNPATEDFHLAWEGMETSGFSIQITDLQGRTVHRYSQPNGSVEPLLLSSSDLPSGFYQVVISQKGKVFSKKLIITH